MDNNTLPSETIRPHFLGFSPAEILAQLQTWQEPKFRGPQVVDWIFKKGAVHPDEMMNLPKALRQKMLDHWDWTLPSVKDQLQSEDGSTKLLLANSKGQIMETVIMRYDGRTSLCVSCQVGCKMACSFCQTGKLGFFSHLGTHDILAQYVLANRILKDEGRRISHVVFMGMGEPLDNYDNTVKAANLLMEEDAYFLSARHITLSTSGLVPRIESLAKDSRAALALSLHAARDELRSELMPINRKYPLARLKESLLSYQKASGRKITLEYILIKDKNCGLREAKELVKFIHGLRVKVNLIPFNAHPGLPYQRPSDEDIRAFQKHLADRSIPAPVRYSKGLDVSAACGQLAAKVADTLSQAPRRRAIVEVQNSL